MHSIRRVIPMPPHYLGQLHPLWAVSMCGTIVSIVWPAYDVCWSEVLDKRWSSIKLPSTRLILPHHHLGLYVHRMIPSACTGFHSIVDNGNGSTCITVLCWDDETPELETSLSVRKCSLFGVGLMLLESAKTKCYPTYSYLKHIPKSHNHIWFSCMENPSHVIALEIVAFRKYSFNAADGPLPHTSCSDYSDSCGPK